MIRSPIDRRARRALQAFLLLAFVLRALIPAGYMPASDRPFALQICPDGLPAQVAAVEHATLAGEHAHHGGYGEHGPPTDDGSHQHETFGASHCVFATVASAGVPEVYAPGATAETSHAVAAKPRQIFVAAPQYRPQQPRGPPALS